MPRRAAADHRDGDLGDARSDLKDGTLKRPDRVFLALGHSGEKIDENAIEILNVARRLIFERVAQVVLAHGFNPSDQIRPDRRQIDDHGAAVG